MASCAARTPRLLQLTNSIGSFRAGIDSWWQAFLAVGLFVMAFSIVGMHQLSLDHELAAPTSTSASAAVAPDVGHQHSAVHDHESVGHITGLGSASLGGTESAAPHGSKAVASPDGSSGGHEDGCPSCGSHTMAFGACLLAFTLLVLSWWLAPPRVRLLPPRLLLRSVTCTTRAGRRVPALSLTQLSILRT